MNPAETKSLRPQEYEYLKPHQKDVIMAIQRRDAQGLQSSFTLPPLELFHNFFDDAINIMLSPEDKAFILTQAINQNSALHFNFWRYRLNWDKKLHMTMKQLAPEYVTRLLADQRRGQDFRISWWLQFIDLNQKTPVTHALKERFCFTSVSGKKIDAPKMGYTSSMAANFFSVMASMCADTEQLFEFIESLGPDRQPVLASLRAISQIPDFSAYKLPELYPISFWGHAKGKNLGRFALVPQESIFFANGVGLIKNVIYEIHHESLRKTLKDIFLNEVTQTQQSLPPGIAIRDAMIDVQNVKGMVLNPQRPLYGDRNQLTWVDNRSAWEGMEESHHINAFKAYHAAAQELLGVVGDVTELH